VPTTRGEPLPPAVAWLGYAGVLPFIGAALAPWVDPTHASLWEYALLAYGAVIVSFVGALHWGVAMTAARAGDGLDRRWTALYAWSVVPSLLAWAALLTHAVLARGTAWAVALLVLAFLAHYVRDRRLAPVVKLPSWYLPLRLQLTTVACLCLLSLALPLQTAAVAHAATPRPAVPSPAAPLQSGDIVLVRHANAPGTGDPAGFRLNDCTTQRNLDEAGRAQARRIGQQVRALGVPVGAVWTSQWCRTRETARLAFSLPAQDMPAFNSFFEDPAVGKARTEAALRALERWSGPGLLVVVTHQVNITGLTGLVPASGEGIAVRRRAGALEVLRRLPAPDA